MQAKTEFGCPTFSVAMSVYENDKPEWLRCSLDSVCTQSLLPNELFMVIDGPISAELESVVMDYSTKYPFMKIHRFANNQGRGNVLRYTMENCSNNLVAIMDSDDIAAPGRFRKLIDAYIQEPADVIGGWTLGFSESIERGRVSRSNRKLSHEEIIKTLPIKCPMSHVTVLLRRSDVINAGNYMDLYYHEDYYLWARMIQNGAVFRNIPEYLVYVRLGAGQAKRHGGIKYFKAEMKLRKFMLDNKLSSLPVFIKQSIIRFIYQILLTPDVRNYVNMRFKRKYISREEVDKIIKADNE